MTSLLLTLFFTYFKIGLFTIGGGYAMIPLIQQEVVQNHQWISLKEFTDFIAVAESTPGPFAVNISTFIGMKLAGFAGALVSTIGVTLPSFLIILAIAVFMKGFDKNPFVKGALYGMTPTVIALILSAVFSLFVSNILMTSIGPDFTLRNVDWKGLVILALAAFSYYRFKLKPIPLILLCAVFGMIFYGLLPMWGLNF